MKQVALLAIIVGLSAVSMAAIYASDLGQTSLVLATPSSDKFGMLGHIEFVQADSSGNIIGYYQTDNFVTNAGASCVATQMFGGAVVAPCTGTVADFLFIGLGDADTGTDDVTQTALVDEMTDADDSSSRRLDTDGASISTLGGGQAEAIVATVTPFTFSIGGANVSNNVFQAGLFDSAATGNAFSLQNTTSGANPGIDVNDGDTLAVTWTITVGT